MPGFVDPHTHVVFAGDRRDELRRRLAGASYSEIAAEGGGILAPSWRHASASEDELARRPTRRRLDEMLRKRHDDLRSQERLRADDRVGAEDAARDRAPADGASRSRSRRRSWARTKSRPSTATVRDAYVELVCGEMIPAVARAGLAEWCDVFCEDGVFTPAERGHDPASPARAAGMKLRIHADELGASGGSQVAADGRCAVGRPPDLRRRRRAPAALAAAGIVATLLPIAVVLSEAAALRSRTHADRLAASPSRWPPTSIPGGGFSPSMPFAMTLACFGMGLTFEEALVGATINAAYSLDRHDRSAASSPASRWMRSSSTGRRSI